MKGISSTFKIYPIIRNPIRDIFPVTIPVLRALIFVPVSRKIRFGMQNVQGFFK
jgi:hypothetical protein